MSQQRSAGFDAFAEFRTQGPSFGGPVWAGFGCPFSVQDVAEGEAKDEKKAKKPKKPKGSWNRITVFDPWRKISATKTGQRKITEVRYGQYIYIYIYMVMIWLGGLFPIEFEGTLLKLKTWRLWWP